MVATKAKAKTEARSRGMSAAQIQVLALTEGATAVLAVLRDGRASAATARKAAESLTASPKVARVILAAADEVAPQGEGRGRTPPVVGEQRVYRAQALSDEGDAWVRVPVSTLGAERGQGVLVSFLDGRIVLAVSGDDSAEF